MDTCSTVKSDVLKENGHQVNLDGSIVVSQSGAGKRDAVQCSAASNGSVSWMKAGVASVKGSVTPVKIEGWKDDAVPIEIVRRGEESSSQSSGSSETKKVSAPTKRKQVKRACTNCRKKHTACDDERPCQQCVRSGCADTCRDSPRKKRKSAYNEHVFSNETLYNQNNYNFAGTSSPSYPYSRTTITGSSDNPNIDILQRMLFQQGELIRRIQTEGSDETRVYSIRSAEADPAVMKIQLMNLNEKIAAEIAKITDLYQRVTSEKMTYQICFEQEKQRADHYFDLYSNYVNQKQHSDC
eukprot:TRINITY_DN7218_c0_g1_i1.p1 TRINITY_DN7218_c0_g1~~TRINITY_DN7218_c0_g1_i1.p1  ORF type:complete len:297 (-),score=44.69 TRINITY_DN7218_c0_g1_i1:62-952(-)